MIRPIRTYPEPPVASNVDSAQQWLLWQLADSAFPTGGFVHSAGLEAVWQLGELRGTLGLEAYCSDSVFQCGRGSLPFVTAAHGCVDLAGLAAVDHLLDAFTMNHVAKRASRGQGSSLLAIAATAFGSAPLAMLKDHARAERLPGHFATMFGAVSSRLGIGAIESQRLFLFLHLRTLISSSVRLSIVGPLEAQALQHRLGAHAEQVLESCRALKTEDAAQPVPLFDLFQGHHDRLYSRLFSS